MGNSTIRELYNGNMRLLSVTETMELLGIGRTKLYQLLDDKIIPSCRVGYSRRVPEEALMDYLESQLADEAKRGG